MVYAIISVLVFGLLTTLLYLFITRKRKQKIPPYLIIGIMVLFCLLHGASYWLLTLFANRPISRFFAHQSFTFLLFAFSLVLTIILASLMYVVHILKNDVRLLSYLHSIGVVKVSSGTGKEPKRYPILPIVSIGYAALLVVVSLLILIILEYSQPMYHEWEDEVAIRSAMHRNVLSRQPVEYYSSDKFPLWRLDGSEVETTGTKNILVLGDSFVYSYGHSDVNQLWWKQLDKVLKQRGYHDVNVYAVGLGGAATYDHMRWLRDTSMLNDLNPDIVILGYVTNDADRYNGEMVLKAYESDIFDRYFLLKPFKRVFPRLAYKINDMLLSKTTTDVYNDETGYPYELKELELIRGQHLIDYDNYAVKPLGEVVSNINIPAFLVTLPNRPDAEYFEPRYQPVLPLFEAAGITVHNMLPDMIAANFDSIDMQNAITNPGDGHPGTSSVLFYANYVADLLERDYPDVLGDRVTEAPDYNVHVNYAMPSSLGPIVISETPTDAVYEITYPNANSNNEFLRLPIDQDYVKLCFQYPVDIKSVRIESSSLEEFTLYTTRIDPDRGYDTQEMFPEPMQTADSGFFWEINADMVTALCFSAKTANNRSAKLTITIEAAEGGVRP